MPQLRHRICVYLLFCLLCALPARASVSLLLEEPFGTFGAFNPTGHAALYFSDICADGPTRVRMCRPGELGVVISRYHRVDGRDWLAVPLVPYLFAVDDLSEVPASATAADRETLRDAYRRTHLLAVAPNNPDGSTPSGEWIQLVGSSYDRKIYGFQLATTREQDEAVVARLNDRRNKSHFNLLYRNCADFSRSMLRSLYPNSIPRNAMADFWLTTPKHLAKSLDRFGDAHPELDYQTFQIPQVPGTIRRSHRVDGIAESLVKSKRYLVPLAVLSPTTAVTLVATYVSSGRFHVPHGAPLMAEIAPVEVGMTLADDTIVLPSDGSVSEADPLACSPRPADSAVGSGSQ